jgi:hypothetical protein
MALPFSQLHRAFAKAFGFASIVLGLALVHAQDDPAKAKRDIPEKTPDVLGSGAIKPDAIYLRNAEGDLIFVPSQRYEDFAQYLRDRALKEAPNLPSYAVDLLRCEIVAHNGFADVDLRLTAQVANPAIQVVQIPLAMSNMNIVEPPEMRGGQNSFVKLSSDGNYSWWIIPDQSKTYELHIKAVVKLTMQASRKNLRLELPQVTSQIRLTVPGTGQEIQLVGTGTEVLENEPSPDSTIANIRGQGGIVNIAWKEPASTVDASSLEVDSVNRLAVTDQSRTWKGSTLFKVQSFGSAQEREFTIKLPPNYRWIPSSTGIDDANMNLLQVVPTGSAPDAQGGLPTEIIVRMRTVSQTTPIELTIDWERPAVPDAEFPLELIGLELEGVQRHEASFELDCPQDYRVSWDAADTASLFQQTRSVTDAGRMTYVFRFSRPPLRLLTQLRRVGPRVVVRPNYMIQVELNRLELTGLVELVTDPSQLAGLRFSMGEWELDRLEPYPANGTQIEIERDANGELIPLFTPATNTVGATPSSETAVDTRRVFRISAHRNWDSSTAANLHVTVPTVVLPTSPNERRSLELVKGFVLLTHANNLQVSGEKAGLEGLIEEQRPPTSVTEMFSAPANNNTHYYRMTNSDGIARWQAQFVRVPQKIYSTRVTDIQLREDHVQVDQRWKIQISNEPLRRLPILVDRRFVAADSQNQGTEFRVVLNGKLVAWTEIPDSSVVGLVPAGVDLSRWAMVEIVSSELLGDVDLQVTSKFPLQETSPGAETPLTIPLTWPTLSGKPVELESQIRIASNELIECFLNTRNSVLPVVPIGQSVDLSIPDEDREVTCRFRKLRRVLADEVQIEQAWLQTLASSESQRGRFVLRFRTRNDRLRIEMPKTWSLASGGILMDGEAIEPLKSEGSIGNWLELDMTQADANKPWHVVEVWSIGKRGQTKFRTLEAIFPRVVDAGRIYPFLWQIVLPRHEHMILSSNNVGAEYRWTWDVFGLVRQSRWDQTELEKRLGASPQSPPPLQTNQYLLSSYGELDGMQIRTAPRYLLWSPVCALALLGFWIWYVWRPARGGLLFLASVLLLVAIMSLATDLAIILGQTLFASLLVITLFRLTLWTVDRRVRQRSIFSPQSSTLQRPSVTSGEPAPPSPSTRSLQVESPPLQEASS